ncbi:MAG: helix-turn-helix domain-containing protein [Candidatus Limnocylindrales bacterium]
MTARQQIRVGRRTGRDRATVDAYAAAGVGDMLHAAREKKGVDLYRAERDTKIRARHLAALEAGDFAELPGSVYVKGFLRNYALYLGLDPAEVLDRWQGPDTVIAPPRSSSRVSVVVPPQPLTDPRRGFTLTPGVLVAAFLAVIVLAFAGYVGLQLARFSQVPPLTLDGQLVRTVAPDQTSVNVTGTAPGGATIDVFDATEQPAGSALAAGDGRWTLDLAVQKGQNDFTIRTRDPETGRDADPLRMIVNVPVSARPSAQPTPAPTPLQGIIASPTDTPDPTIEPTGAATPAPSVGPATLQVSSPRSGTRSGDAKVTVQGKTDAPGVRVRTRWLSEGKRPGNPGTTEVRVRDGSFEYELVLAPGRWEVIVETEPTDLLTRTRERRRIRVDYEGFVVVLGARPGGRAWLQVTADGVEVESGRRLRAGDRIVVQARDMVTFLARSERRTMVGVQGDAPVQLSDRSGSGIWSVTNGEDPVPVP